MFFLFKGGPGSPFQNNWQLRDDYNIRSNQMELAQRLSKLIFWVAVANLIMAPAIFLWQLIYFSFAYANVSPIQKFDLKWVTSNNAEI